MSYLVTFSGGRYLRGRATNRQGLRPTSAFHVAQGSLYLLGKPDHRLREATATESSGFAGGKSSRAEAMAEGAAGYSSRLGVVVFVGSTARAGTSQRWVRVRHD